MQEFQITVSYDSATTFQPGDRVRLCLYTLKEKIKFFLVGLRGSDQNSKKKKKSLSAFYSRVVI